MKQTSKRISLKLNPEKDQDILEFIQAQHTGTATLTIKKAIRVLIAIIGSTQLDLDEVLADLLKQRRLGDSQVLLKSQVSHENTNKKTKQETSKKKKIKEKAREEHQPLTNDILGDWEDQNFDQL